MRDYQSIHYWWLKHPGAKALILQRPGGPSFILKKQHSYIIEEAAYALLGVID